MKTLIRLFITDLKMLVRNRQALMWSLIFPLVFTVIFGAFFGKNGTNAGIVAYINKSQSAVAKSMDAALASGSLLKVDASYTLDSAQAALKKGEITNIIYVPESFGSPGQGATTNVVLYSDPSNLQAAAVVQGVLNQFLTSLNYTVQNAKPIFGIEQKTINASGQINYFDFVLVGLLGMALMNSSVQGIAIAMANYRDDKILKRITTTPLKTWKFIVAEVFSRLVINIVQISLILLVGINLFGAHIYGSFLMIYLFVLLGAVLFQLIGFAIASISKTTDAAQGMAVAVTIPMMFLAGVFFPVDQLPKWIGSIVQFLPLAPLLRMIRAIALEKISPFENVNNIIIVSAWIVLMLLVSIRRFRLTEE